MARAELQLLAESGSLWRGAGSPAAPGSVTGRLTEDRVSLFAGSHTFPADLQFKGWRVWILQGGEQRVSQGHTRIAHSPRATFEGFHLSHLCWMTFHLSKPHYGLKSRSVSWKQPEAVWILHNSSKIKTCYVSLQTVCRNDQIMKSWTQNLMVRRIVARFLSNL